MWFFNNKKPKKRKPNARIVVAATKLRVMAYVPKNKIPYDSFERYYRNRKVWLHELGCNLKGKLWPLMPRPAFEGKTPIELFMARHCTEDVQACYGGDLPTIEKVKLGILVGLCVAILIVIFLIASSIGG